MTLIIDLDLDSLCTKMKLVCQDMQRSAPKQDTLTHFLLCELDLGPTMLIYELNLTQVF